MGCKARTDKYGLMFLLSFIHYLFFLKWAITIELYLVWHTSASQVIIWTPLIAEVEKNALLGHDLSLEKSKLEQIHHTLKVPSSVMENRPKYLLRRIHSSSPSKKPVLSKLLAIFSLADTIPMCSRSNNIVFGKRKLDQTAPSVMLYWLSKIKVVTS